MKILTFISKEIYFFKKSNLLGKLFIINLFLWCISIPVKNAIFQFSTALFAILFFIHFFTNKKSIDDLKQIFIQFKEVFIGLILITLSLFLSTLLSEFAHSRDFYLIGKDFYRYGVVFFILIYFYSNNIFSKKVLILFIILSLLFYSLHGIYQFFVLNNFTGSVQSFLHNRNPYGLIMYIGIMVGTFLLYKIKEIQSQVIIYIIISFFLASMFLSYSRSSWVATAIFLLIFSTISFKSINFKKVLINGTFLIVVALFFYINDGLHYRFESLIHLDSSERFDIWINAIGLIKEKILLGYGLIDYKLIGLSQFPGVHNSFLEVLLFSGLLGMFSYTYTIVVVILDILKSKNYLFLSILFSLLVISQFDYSVTKGKIFLSILTIAMFFILSHRVEKDDSDKVI